MKIENNPIYIPDKIPTRDKSSHLVYAHAPEVTFSYSANFWEQCNASFNKEGLDRSDSQIVVLTTYPDDVTTKLYRSFSKDSPTRYPVATTLDQEFPDGELEMIIDNEAVNAQFVYIVSSILSERDFSRARRVADHYKRTLNAKCVTLVSSFMGATREDKNIGKGDLYKPNTISIRSEIRALSDFIDRIIVIEPHSSATQAFAAESNIPLAPLSPWKLMIDDLMRNGVYVRRNENLLLTPITKDNAVVARPDKGRNLAATRLERYTGMNAVSFDKVRISGQEVFVYELTPEEQRLVKGRIAILYDDEASTMGTIYTIANALKEYGAEALAACLVHCKFTPGWERKIIHPLLTTVLGTDSRRPIGNIQRAGNIRIVSLEPLIRDIIKADIDGINFWRDSFFRDMILQSYEEE